MAVNREDRVELTAEAEVAFSPSANSAACAGCADWEKTGYDEPPQLGDVGAPVHWGRAVARHKG